MALAEHLADGLDAESAAALVPNLSTRTDIMVLLPTLDAMIRSGRLSRPVGALGRRSRLKLLISLNAAGKSALRGAALSGRGMERQLLAGLRRRLRSTRPARWAVVHAAAAAAADRLAAEAADVLGTEPAYIMPTSPSLGTHACTVSVALAVQWQPGLETLRNRRARS